MLTSAHLQVLLDPETAQNVGFELKIDILLHFGVIFSPFSFGKLAHGKLLKAMNLGAEVTQNG